MPRYPHRPQARECVSLLDLERSWGYCDEWKDHNSQKSWY